MMKAHLFRAACLTNMHVGSGEENYNIIDKEVERDPVITYMPVIHASGVKGALKEHCEACMDKKAVTQIFGNPDGDKKTIAGNYKFFGASLIARPLRVSQGKASFILASTPEIIKTYITFLDGIGYRRFSEISTELEGLEIGNAGFVSVSQDIKEIEGKCVVMPKANISNAIRALFHDKPFALTESLKEYSLPVIARNKLDENGISENLWYEEIVPHQSIFYFAVLAPDKVNSNGIEVLYNDFKKAVEENPVQFGGNASIGYGFTRVEEVE